MLPERHYVFVSGSFVHDMWLKIQKDMHFGEIPKELKKLRDTIDGRAGMLLAELCVTDRAGDGPEFFGPARPVVN